MKNGSLLLSVGLVVGACASSGGDERLAAQLGLRVDDVRTLKASKRLTDDELLAMPKGRLDRLVKRLAAAHAGHPLEALQWRALTLVDANGVIPPNAAVVAKQQMQALAAADGTVGGLDEGLWDNLGPDNIGGRTRGLAIDPGDPLRMFAGSVGGGIWRTADGGASWQRVGDDMTNLAVTEIVFEPGDNSVLYASTGEGFGNVDAIRGAGIWKSTDSGASWAQLAFTATPDFHYVNALDLSPNGQVLLAATNSGMWRSTDGGGTFSHVINSGDSRCLDVEFHPTDDSRVVASLRDYDLILGTSYNAPVWSDDGGVSWTELGGALRTTGFYDRIELAWHRGYTGGGGGCVYLQQYVHTSGDTNLFRSLDGGQSYTFVSNSSITGSQGWYDNCLWVDPSDTDADPADDVLVVGGIDLHRSLDGGASFDRISEWFNWPQSAHADHHRIVEHPGFDGSGNKTVMFANDGGVWRTDDVYAVDPLNGWINLNNGYRVTQFYGASHSAAGGVLVGGTQDNGTLRTTTSPSHTTMFGGDGGFCASDPSDPAYHYGEYVYLRIHRSTDGGLTSDYIHGPISGGNFIAPFVLDPNDPNVMLAGGDELWRSSDVKAPSPSWSITKQDNNSNISAIAVTVGNGARQFVGHNNGRVYRTLDGDQASPTWTRLDDNATSLPGRYVTRITIDPHDEARIFVTFGGYAADNVWVSRDSGDSWDALADVPAAPVRDLEVHPVHSNWLYVASEVGLLVSEDSGQTWSSAASPASVSIDELFVSDDHLYLATHGLGIFRQSLLPTAMASDVGAPCTVGGPASGPTLWSSQPAIGSNWTWLLSQAPANGVAALYFSATPTAPAMLSPGCFAQIDLQAFGDLGIRITTGTGTANWTVSFPNNPALVGFDYMTQAACVTAAGIQVSNGRRLIVGL